MIRQLYLCVTTQHDPTLLVLAAALCALGAYASVVLARHAATTRERKLRVFWILATALSCTSAIWATHFIAMLAFRTVMPSGFVLGPTVGSFVVALVMITFAFCVAFAERVRHATAIGGAIAGLAISAMHYLGVSAFRVVGTIAWDPLAVAASVAVGLGFATLAWLTFHSRNVLIPTGLFTIAVCGNHLLGMSAAAVSYDPRVVLPAGLIDEQHLAEIVATVAMLIIGITLAAVSVHRKGRRRDEAEKQQLQQLTDVAVEGLMICDGPRVVWINRSLELMLPGSRADHVGSPVDALLLSIPLQHLPHDREVDGELRVGVDERAPVRLITRPIRLRGRRHLVVAIRDQRERLRAEAEMQRVATSDPLTGLANRARFNAVLAQMFAFPIPRGGHFALLALDLDRFKSVNDACGHAAGDAVLIEVAVRLTSLVREGDLVARLGGDEFSILAAKGDDPNEIAGIASRVIEALSQPFCIQGRSHQIGVSVGIAFALTDARDAEALTRAADLALYRAKAEGRGVYRMFEPGMNTRMQERLALEQALRQAIARDEFQLYYQPQVDARTGVINGAEALIRWLHPTRGLVMPGDFIALAEETKLIVPIGEWALRTACREAATWPDHLNVAVNLSPVQFGDPSLAGIVRAALEASGLPAHRLELEVTESVLIDDEVHVKAVLDDMKSLGIRISLDDFGTGYSSLGHLRRFPFDKIKIDQSFTSRVPDDRDSAAIVRAVVSIGASLGLSVTAEGVEDEAQRCFVVAAGCDQIQGYLFGRPVAAAALPFPFRAAVRDHDATAGPVGRREEATATTV